MNDQEQRWVECSYCGKWLKTDEMFCPDCARLNDGEGPEPPEKVKPSIALLAILLIFIPVIYTVLKYF